MRLGIIADDYTGASDIANTLARGGLSTVQFLGVPTGAPTVACDAAVVALKIRSAPVEEAVATALAAQDWLAAQGCRQFVWKICSTFDSTPEGNVGPVGEALAARLEVAGVPVCPAFPTTGRTVYRGHLFVGDRPLDESGMEHHPLNPMTDADIRRWLERQSRGKVGLVPWPVVAEGPQAIAAALAAAAARGETQVIVDALTDADLVAIGRAAKDAPLLVGGSGIAIGLPENLFAAGLARPGASAFRPQSGPEAILAGSCSQATLGQVERHRATHPALPIDVPSVMEGRVDAAALVAFLRGNAGKAPIAYSSSSPGTVLALQERYGREEVARRLDALFADTARALVADGVRRLVVAGGETSGAVVSALGLDALAIGPEIDPGVPALGTLGGPPLALALKSGNFGAPDFFEKAMARLEGR